MAYRRLVRFRERNDVFYGDLLETRGDEFLVRKFLGDPFDALQETDEILKTKEVRIVTPFEKFSWLTSCSFSVLWKGRL